MTTHNTETRSVRVGRGDGWLAICHGCDWEGPSRRARETAEDDASTHRADNRTDGFTVEGTRDEYGEDRWFAASREGDWPGESHPTRELAQDACDRLNA